MYSKGKNSRKTQVRTSPHTDLHLQRLRVCPALTCQSNKYYDNKDLNDQWVSGAEKSTFVPVNINMEIYSGKQWSLLSSILSRVFVGKPQRCRRLWHNWSFITTWQHGVVLVMLHQGRSEYLFSYPGKYLVSSYQFSVRHNQLHRLHNTCNLFELWEFSLESKV